MDLDTTIRKYVLQNAIKFKGKANPGAIIGKVFGEDPELKKQAKVVSQKIQEIVKDVNSMSVEDQTAELQTLAPELLEKKEHVKKDIYAVLNIQEGDTVVGCFPPEPSKYPHIGHAKALHINYELAQKYKGKFFLRFDDTNPDNAKQEYVDMHQSDYKWLGVSWDEVVYASDYMDKFNEFAVKLIKEGNAYMCACKGEQIKEGRMKGIPCSCREQTPDDNLNRWREFPDDAILRLKTDIAHKNSAMRDPTIFRKMKGTHYRVGTDYDVWPTYDFENPVMDGLMGATHRLRTKEFEMRTPLHNLIQELCGLPQTTYYEMARFNMKGVLASGRVIREKVESGELLGWDDPSLTTVCALRRRGFLPQAIRDFTIGTGMTKSEATLTWDDLIMHNKRLLETDANRYFFIEAPQQIKIEKAPGRCVELDLHPELRKGGRKLQTTEDYYLSPSDLQKCEEEKVNRLIDNLNFIKQGDNWVFHSDDLEEYKNNKGVIAHWLPVDEKLVSIEIMMPDKSVKKGLAEPSVKDVKVDSVIQFERFGFCRLDEIKDDGTYKFWFTH